MCVFKYAQPRPSLSDYLLEREEATYLRVLPPALQDANGQPIPAQQTAPDVTDTPVPLTGYWALRTTGKSFPGPWTLSLASAQIEVATEAALQIDLGPNPQTGQTWPLDQELELAGRGLRISQAALREDEAGKSWLELSFAPDAGLVSISLWDADPGAGVIGVRGSNAGNGAPLLVSIGYSGRPSGVRDLVVRGARFTVQGPWQVQWMPAGARGAPAATPQAAQKLCLSAAQWEKLRNGSQPPPAVGVSGWLLVQRYTGGHMPEISLARADGSQQRVLTNGAWSALSPDGSTVAYLPEDGAGLRLVDVQTRASRPLTGTVQGDYSPRWSPDGKWIAFVRIAEDVYIIHPDGTGLRSLGGTGSISLAGWLPDSRGLVITVLGRDGSQVQTLDIETGAIQKGFLIENAKGGFPALSPDGQRLAFQANVAGQPGHGYELFVANRDGSGRHLIADPGLGGISATTWSPGGDWLAVTAGQMPLLIQPDTCQVMALTAIQGEVVGWVPAQP